MTDASQTFDEGFAAHRQGDLDRAAEFYDAAITADPANAKALHMLGVIHLQRREFELAVELIRRAVAIDNQDAAAFGNLSSALIGLNRIDEAIEAGRKGVQLNGQAVDIWGNLGAALTRASRYAEAVEAYRAAIAIQPDRPGLHSALGHCLGELEDFDAALRSHRTAIELAPDKPQYRNNMAVTLRAMKLDAEAEEMLRSAIEGGLDDVEVRGSFAGLLQRRGKLDEALATYRAARDAGLDHTKLDSAMLFHQNHRFEDSPLVAKADAIDWARRAAAGVTPYSNYTNPLTTVRPVRVGLVSGDLRVHPVGRYLEAWLGHLDPNVITLFAYSAVDNDDAVNRRLHELIPNWRSIRNLPDEKVAADIRHDRIDVLIDLSGHTAHHRLRVFLYKPAPVAVTWLGYFATTGVSEIEYVLCNEWLLPPEEEEQWVEKPWRLPNSHWCYGTPVDAPHVAASPALESGYVTFGCYNNFAKLNADTIALWSRILASVPNSRLLLRSGNKNESTRQSVLAAFARNGISAGERLVVEARAVPLREHLQSYEHIDIALDPFPYNGGTTTSDALYMGVPVLTLRGDRFVGHLSESNLRSAGLDDWVAEDFDDYVRRACAFAADIPRLAEMRAGLRSRVLQSTLFNAALFARHFEAAMTGMWAKWSRARRP